MSLTEISDAISEASKQRYRKVKIQILTVNGEIEHEKEFAVTKSEASYIMYAIGVHRDWIVSQVSYMWQQIQQALHTQE